jgi:hypothetical protein
VTAEPKLALAPASMPVRWATVTCAVVMWRWLPRRPPADPSVARKEQICRFL